MATTINADTSNGLKITSDTSGVIEFQSAGTTKAGVNSTGLTGDGSQLTGISSIPSQLVTSKTVTGSVTALRAVSNAADGSIGAYPVLNTVTSGNDSLSAPGTNDKLTGKTRLRAAGGRSVATPLNKGECRIFGSYLNGSNQWVENSTPLVVETQTLNHQVDSGTAFIWGHEDGKFLIANTNITNAGAEASVCITMLAITVNASTGAPTTVGTNREVYYDANVSGARGNTVKIPSQEYCQVKMQSGDATFQYREFYYTSGAGWGAATSSTSAIFESTFTYPVHTVSNNAADNPYNRLYGIENADDSKLIQTSTNGIRTLAISSHAIQATTAVNVTLSADYNTEGQTTMLDATHCLQIYKDTDGVRKMKTFTVAADGSSVSLLDTFTLPASFEDSNQFIFKDSKNLVLWKQGRVWSSIGLDSDFTILGTNLNYSGYSPQSIQYSGSGNVFNAFTDASGTTDFSNAYQQITINAFSTPPFNYTGITKTTSSSGSVDVVVAGIVAGYTSLPVDTVYYVNNTYDGTFTSNSSFGTPRIGKAISPTQILLGEVL